MQRAEEEKIVFLDLTNEDQKSENDQGIIDSAKKIKAKVEVKEIAKPPFLLKRVVLKIRRKFLEMWAILGEDEYG
jgi:hypothetical protein